MVMYYFPLRNFPRKNWVELKIFAPFLLEIREEGNSKTGGSNIFLFICAVMCEMVEH